MIDHTGIGVADVRRSATFYDAALEALGMRRVMQMPHNVGTDGVGYGFDYPVFWIDRYHPHSVKQHTAFAAKNRTEVDAFHAAALKAGGTENGAPGVKAELLRRVCTRSRWKQHRGGLPWRLRLTRKVKAAAHKSRILTLAILEVPLSS